MIKKLSIALVVVAIMSGIFTVGVSAAVFDEDGIIEEGEIIEDDVFLDAQYVIVDGTINGTLFAGGETITINGVINGDAFLGAETIIISDTAKIEGNLIFGSGLAEIEGEIAGSIFGGAASVVLQENVDVARNCFFWAYSIELEEEAKVARDFYGAAYQVILSGDIAREAHVEGEAVEFTGKIGEDAVFKVGAPGSKSANVFGEMLDFYTERQLPNPIAPGLRIAETAEIGGELTYISAVPQLETIQAEPIGGISYMTPEPDEYDEPKPANLPAHHFLNRVIGIFQNFFTLIILGGLLLWLLPDSLVGSASQIDKKALSSAGYGFLTIIIGYVGAVLVAVAVLIVGVLFSIVTLGGLSRTVFGVGYFGLSLAVIVFSFLVSYGSKLVVAFWGGQWMMGKIAPEAKRQQVWALFIGVFVYVFLRAIPILGLLIALAVTLLGLGAIWFYYREWQQPVVSEAE